MLAGATARRVLTQLRHDPRTIAMMVAVPTVLMILLRYVVANSLLLEPGRRPSTSACSRS